jgi:hypothetical protein
MMFGLVTLKIQKKILGRTWWKTTCRCGEIRHMPQYDLSSVAKARFCKCAWRNVSHQVKVFAKNLRGRLKFSMDKLGVARRRAKSFDLLGYSPMDLYKHLSEYLGKACEVCKLTVVSRKNCHIDHKIALMAGKTEGDILVLNRLSNLRLICATCNLRKIGNSFSMEVCR